ncbi:MAG: oligosaccharide flippase family protein [Bacteroidia bacterium]
MFKYLKQLAGESAIYGLSSILIRFIGLFATPIYTRIFLPHDYGVMGLVNTLFMLVGVVLVLGLDSATALYFYERKGEEQKHPVATWFWTQLVLTLFLCLLCSLFSNIFSRWFIKEADYGILIKLGAFNLLFSLFSAILSNWFRLQRKAMHTVAFTFVISIVNIGVSILLVVHYKMGIAGIYWGALTSNLLACAVAIYFMHDWLSIKYFDLPLLKKMFHFSLPLIPASFAYWALNSSGSYFIDHYLNKTEVGLYQIGMSLASGMLLFVGAFQAAWGPFALSFSQKPDAKQIYAATFMAYTVISSSLFVMLCIFSKEILLIITTSVYVDAYKVGCLLALNCILSGYNYIASIGLAIAKTNSPYAKIVIAGACLTVVLYMVLIPVFGKEGAAVANVAGQLMVPVYMFYAANKYYPVNYPYRKATTIFGTAILFSLAGLNIGFNNMVLLIVVKTFIVLVFGFVMYLFNKNTVNKVAVQLKAAMITKRNVT